MLDKIYYNQVVNLIIYFLPSALMPYMQSLDAVKRICPKKALLIGMNHEFEHHRENQILAEWSHRCVVA